MPWLSNSAWLNHLYFAKQKKITQLKVLITLKTNFDSYQMDCWRFAFWFTKEDSLFQFSEILIICFLILTEKDYDPNMGSKVKFIIV